MPLYNKRHIHNDNYHTQKPKQYRNDVINYDQYFDYDEHSYRAQKQRKTSLIEAENYFKEKEEQIKRQRELQEELKNIKSMLNSLENYKCPAARYNKGDARSL